MMQRAMSRYVPTADDRSSCLTPHNDAQLHHGMLQACRRYASHSPDVAINYGDRVVGAVSDLAASSGSGWNNFATTLRSYWACVTSETCGLHTKSDDVRHSR